LISSGGLKIAKITDAASPQWPKGTVIEQTPGQGSKVSGDSAIEIVVAQ
jgi:beta-lactam-binding protein with PASTA domain